MWTYIASTWCTCVLPLQPYSDKTSVLFCRLINVNILLLFKQHAYVIRLKCPTTDTLLMWYTCTSTLQPYRNITSVMFCRLINVDIWLLFLTIFIRYKTEMQDNRHIVESLYMYILLFKFINRSYRYTFHGHLIPTFTSSELWPSGYDGGFVS